MAVDPDDGERRPEPQPRVQRERGIADDLDAGAQPERAAEALRLVVEARDRLHLGVGRAGATSSQMPSTASVAVLVDQRREHPRQRHHGIGNRAAGHAGVHRPVERAQLDVGRGEAAERVGDAGHADLPVARVGEHEHVAAQLVEVLGEEAVQRRRPDLLFALDEHAHVARRGARRPSSHAPTAAACATAPALSSALPRP